MKKTWFLISCNLELNCKSYKRNRKLCFKNEKNELQILLFIPSEITVHEFTVHFALRLGTVHFALRLGTVHFALRLCTVHQTQTVLFTSDDTQTSDGTVHRLLPFFTDSRKNLYLTFQTLVWKSQRSKLRFICWEPTV